MITQKTSLAIILAVSVLTQHLIITTSGSALLVRINEAYGRRSVNDKELEIDGFDESQEALIKKRDKRWVGAVIMGASIIINLGSVGLEAYGAIKGCCGFYPEACRNLDTVHNKLVPLMQKKSRDIDYVYLEATNLLHYVKQNNHNNRDIWQAIKKLSQYTKDLVTLLDPNVTIAFDAKQQEIQKAIAAKNRTVLNLSALQLSTAYDSLFHSAFGTARAIGGILGYGFYYAAAYAFTEFRVNQAAKTLDTKYGKLLRNAAPKAQKFFGFTDKNIQSHLKETARSQYNRKMATSKLANFVSGAGYLYTAVSAGMQIWGAIKKVDGCKKIRDKTRGALAKVRQTNRKFDKLLAEVTAYRNNVTTTGWNFVKGQITGEEFTNVLKHIADVAKRGSQRSKPLRDAYNTINYFIANIEAADQRRTYDLQRQLIKALRVPTRLYECYDVKVRVINYVRGSCRIGSYSMRSLYDQAVKAFKGFNSNTCSSQFGVPSSSFSDINKLVGDMMTKEKLQADCILNSRRTKASACLLRDAKRLSVSQIAAHLKITEAQASFFIATCPARTHLTENEKKQLCTLRKKGLSDKFITLQFFGNRHLLPAVKAYNSCPLELTVKEKQMICYLRKRGVPDHIIVTFLQPRKPLALVTAVKC